MLVKWSQRSPTILPITNNRKNLNTRIYVENSKTGDKTQVFGETNLIYDKLLQSHRLISKASAFIYYTLNATAEFSVW